MLRNYLLTAFRNLKRNKVYAILNILGLSLGIGCATVIFKVTNHEFSFDKHHVNYNNIFRIVAEDIYPDDRRFSMGVPHPLAGALKEEFPEVKEVVRTFYAESGQVNTMKNEKIDEKFLIDEGITFTENTFFQIFTVEWIAGDAATALTRPKTVVISEKMSELLFGKTASKAHEVVGETLNYENELDLEIVGVIKDLPATTSLPFTMLIHYADQESINPYYQEGKRWNSSSSSTNAYFVVEKGFEPSALEKKLVNFVEKYHGEGGSEDKRYYVQPLADLHYSKRFDGYVETMPKESLWGLVIIGCFLILTASINFVNLAAAQASNRAKEIGIRKAIGGRRRQVVVQFFLEIFLITLFAGTLALMVGELLFIYIEDIIGYRLSIFPFTDLSLIGFLLVVLVIVTLLSASYPSFLLSRMNTVMALKNKITARQHSGGLSLRKGLVVLQFSISQFMIVGTLIIYAQMDFFLNKELGFSHDAIITTYLPDRDEVRRERFREELLRHSTIQDVTFCIAGPTGENNATSNFNYPPLESENDYSANFKPVDERFIDFYDIRMLAGRKIERSDSFNVVVANRKVADLMGFKGRYEEVIGEKLTTGFRGEKEIVGVMENFHNSSLHDDLDYVMLLNYPEAYYEISFKISSLQSLDQAINHFKASWEMIFPQYVINWEFYDEQLARRYESEKQISSLMNLFSIISIVIGCLGLYGLVSFIAQNRMKEIGVRKVLGASIANILGLFGKEIVILLLFAFLLSGPTAFYFLDSWLKEFTYSIELSLVYFGMAFVISMLLALITVGHRTISSALVNPAIILKDE